MPDVLIVADTIRSAELRHEIPLSVPDAFLYLERDGQRHVVVPSMEGTRIAAAAPGVVVHPWEEFGVDELYAEGKTSEEANLEITLRACRSIGVASAVVPH